MSFKVSHLAVLFFAMAFVSCSTSRSNLAYFEDIQNNSSIQSITNDYVVSILPDDELFITVTSEQPAASAAFNLPMVNPAYSGDISTSSQGRQQTYVVDTDGNINFPLLGKVQVQGLTTEQLTKNLTSQISNYVKDPIVTVQLVNFRVKVLGEVKTPGSITITRNRYSILDAIADAGDLTEYGERNNVLLIREENGKINYYRFDLTSSDVLTSPYFYLKQNDAIYVSPNKIREDNSKYNQNNAFKLSVTSTIVSACSVVASLIIALAVK
jgi:polysaccharide export outer membrane protein